jgi:hypothetical protein
MDQAGASGSTETGDPSGALRIDSSGQLVIPLTPVDIGGRRAIHNDIPGTKGFHGNAGLSFLGIGEIDLRACQGDDLDAGP